MHQTKSTQFYENVSFQYEQNPQAQLRIYVI